MLGKELSIFRLEATSLEERTEGVWQRNGRKGHPARTEGAQGPGEGQQRPGEAMCQDLEGCILSGGRDANKTSFYDE